MVYVVESYGYFKIWAFMDAITIDAVTGCLQLCNLVEATICSFWLRISYGSSLNDLCGVLVVMVCEKIFRNDYSTAPQKTTIHYSEVTASVEMEAQPPCYTGLRTVAKIQSRSVAFAIWETTTGSWSVTKN